MRSHNTWICFAIFSVLLAVSPVWAARADAKKIDLSVTSKYVNDWGARDTFPDSPSFAYMNTFCRLALGERIGGATKKKIIGYLKKCQRPDGGFAANPDLKGGSNVIFTCYALATLDLIHASSAINTKKAANFVLSLVCKDGGIKLTPPARSANLGTTYYGVRSLHLLKALDRIHRKRTVAYIESHRDDGRGFGVFPGKPSAPQSTFMAVESLKLLGGLTDDIRSGVMGYLKQTPYSGLGKPENQSLESMYYMACVLKTASVLSGLRQFDAAKIHGFIQSLYIPENGGFGPSPCYGTTPPSTYYAVECLVELGKLKVPNPALQ